MPGRIAVVWFLRFDFYESYLQYHTNAWSESGLVVDHYSANVIAVFKCNILETHLLKFNRASCWID